MTKIMLDIAMTALPPTLDHSSSSLPSSWILDGFPRTVAQGRMLDERLAKQGRPLNKIVNLGVSDGTILKRISGQSDKLDYSFETGQSNRRKEAELTDLWSSIRSYG
jgi:adenylate kinase family enzyme